MWPRGEMLLSLRPRSSTRGERHSMVVLFPSSKECTGFWGLWHFFNRCLNVAVDLSSRLDPARKDYWNRQNTHVLIFYAQGGGHAGCELPPMVDRWRPLIQAMFKGGVYKNPECFTGEVDVDRFVLVQNPPKKIVLASDDLKLLYREAATAAFEYRPLNFKTAKNNKDLLRIVHMVRDDKGSRALDSDQPLVEAFSRQAYQVEWIRCCNFSANNSTRVALQAVASADVLLGMHGAGLTHSYWMRKRGVVVDILAEKPDRSSWYYKDLGYHTSYVSFALSIPANNRRAIMNRTIADSIASCAIAILYKKFDGKKTLRTQICNPKTSPGLVGQYLETTFTPSPPV